MSHFDFDVIFTFPQRRSLRWFVDDRIDDYLTYRLPCKIDSEVKRKLPGAMETYLRDHERMRELMRRTEETVERKSSEVLRRITNEDAAQNAVFGAFMDNTTRRVDANVQRVMDAKNREIEELKINQRWLTAGLLGSIGMTAYSIFSPKN